jgi:hypothetical protein
MKTNLPQLQFIHDFIVFNDQIINSNCLQTLIIIALAYAFVLGVMDFDPQQRLTAAGAMQHAWLNEGEAAVAARALLADMP